MLNHSGSINGIRRFPNIISAKLAGFTRIISGEATGVDIGFFDNIIIRDYLVTEINDGVSMSLAVDQSDC